MAAILLACHFLLVPSSVFAAVTQWQPEAEPIKSHLTIQVARGDWGHAALEDIQRLLVSVADEFQPYVGLDEERELKIRVVPRGGSPRVLYDRGPDGEYIVHLTARDERWYQYAYQFSHELCHIFSNFDHKERNLEGEVATQNQWFEESLCEAASLFTLRSLAATWEQSPPTRNWMGYARIFASYSDHLLAQTHRHLSSAQALDHWYGEHRASLRENPYLREKNELVATTLLQMFEQDPHLWHAITYLNRDRSSAGKQFSGYLADWYTASPLKSRLLADQTMILFGITSATATSSLMPEQNFASAQ